MLAGLTIGNRYSLVSREDHGIPGVERWIATDTRLDAPVTLLAFTGPRPDDAVAAAHRARLVRDPHLPRVIEVADAEDDTPAYAVIERRAGTRLSELLAERVVPAPIARAIIGEAALGLQAAGRAGLEHGAVRPEAISVTTGGRVLVEGAGIDAALLKDGKAASEGAALAALFADAVAGVRLDPETGEPVPGERGDLPDELTEAQRELLELVADSGQDIALEDVITALAPWDAAPLRRLRGARRSWALVVPAAPTAAPVPAPTPGPSPTVEEAAEQPEAVAATTLDDSLVDEGLLDEVLLEEEWPSGTDLDLLDGLPEARLEPLPTLTEAFLGWMHRRFPQNTRVADALERVQRGVSAAPRVRPTPWLFGTMLAVLLVSLIVAVGLLVSPFTPDFDLNNNPPQEYPPFTFDPSESPSP